MDERIRDFWDRDADTYDRSTSHAISDPVEAAAWRAALRHALPDPPARVLDAGAGTGALSLLAAELGYRVTALDLSEGMLGQAKKKAAERGLEIEFVTGPATDPPPGSFDAVIERHLIWTLPDPMRAMRAWRDASAKGGRLVLFEGIWYSDGPVDRTRELAVEAARRLLGEGSDHHAPYPEEVLPHLPFARLTSLRPITEGMEAAGWRAVRLWRLRDVEAAQRALRPRAIGWLERHARYALVADA